MSDLTDRLDAIEARANAATEGPWRTGHRYHDANVVYEQGALVDSIGQAVFVGQLASTPRAQALADATFTAAARSDVPALVVAIRAVLELCDEADKAPFTSTLLYSDEVRGVLRDALS